MRFRGNGWAFWRVVMKLNLCLTAWRKYRLDAVDHGRILRHGDGPGQCDKIGAREAIVFQWKGIYYLHYDGAGAQGWLACLATSKDLTNWTKQGPALRFGPKGSLDSGTASSPWVYNDRKW